MKRVLFAATLAFAFAASASAADAFVYWANERTDTIGRSALDGSRADQEFIAGASTPCGVVVDADHIYWANFDDGTIGRADIDGTNVDQAFISGADKPCGVAVDAAHVYWATIGNGEVGRADLDGDNAGPIVAGGTDTCGVAVNSTNVFWANGASPSMGGSIGRSALNGTGPDQAFVPALSFPCGVAVDSQYLYWAGFGSFGRGTTIGRAGLDGSDPDPEFVTNAGDGPCGVAVDSTSIYWVNRSGDTIGKAAIDGSGADQNFVVDADRPCGIAVDALEPPPPTNRFRLGPIARNKSNGTARVEITVEDAGRAVLAGSRLVRSDRIRFDGAGSAELRVRPTGKAARKLRRNGSVKVTANVVFTPDDGDPREKRTRIKLVRR